MLTRLLAITAFLALATAFPARAATYDRYPGYDPEGRHNFERLRKELDLSKEQARQIRAIIGERREQLAPLRERCRTDRTAMREYLQRGDLHAEALRQIAHRQADCRIDQMLLRHSAREQIAGVLTPEQHARWEQHRQERHDRFPGRGNHRGWGAQRKFE